MSDKTNTDKPPHNNQIYITIGFNDAAIALREIFYELAHKQNRTEKDSEKLIKVGKTISNLLVEVSKYLSVE